ncbi:tropomyosin-like [Ambystoma mexicanum]|uniref:tropomyosin-like n=1 Tax=Ambystoma mexicanum TaxID=8296 RepID=UPI0037E7F014
MSKQATKSKNQGSGDIKAMLQTLEPQKRTQVQAQVHSPPPERAEKPEVPTIRKSDLLEMLLELKKDIKESANNLAKSISDLNKGVVAIEKRIDEVETVVTEQSHEHDILANRVLELEHQMERVHNKQEDAENRSRRKNIRIREVLKSITDSDLQQYVIDLFRHILNEEETKEIGPHYDPGGSETILAMDTTETGAAATKGDIAALLSKIKNLGANLGSKIDKITQRIDNIEERLEGVENNQASIDTLETQMDLRIREIEKREEEWTI